MADRKYRERYKANAAVLGNCSVCFIRPNTPPFKTCECCRVKMRAAGKRWRDANPALAKAAQIRSEAKRPGRYADVRRRYQQRLKDALFERYGECCVQCGFSDRRALQFDHVNGGGTQARKRINKKGLGNQYWKHVLEAPEGVFQVLCANCNSIKRHVNKEWPNNGASNK